MLAVQDEVVMRREVVQCWNLPRLADMLMLSGQSYHHGHHNPQTNMYIQQVPA